jgi:hypothetical protein
MFFVSIDPGKHVCGWALWSVCADRALERDLIACGLWGPRVGDLILPPPLEALTGCAVIDGVYLESMEIRGTGSKTPPSDLLAVEGVGHLFTGLLRPRKLVTWTATTWKGSVPKDVHHPRIRAALRPDEIQTLDLAIKAAPRTSAKEILDAVGIGLYGLGRTHRGGALRP